MSDVFYKQVVGKIYAAPQYGKEITLKVGEDIEGNGVAAISEEAMAELGISEMETIEIIGAWTQQAKAIMLREGDMAAIRIDERIRKSLPVAIGQEVGVRKKYIS